MRTNLALSALAFLALALPSVASASTPQGIWANPANSVHVAFKPCGGAICGKIVWASDKARSDARRGSAKDLVGSMLFQDFVEERRGVWRGTVFVPDIGQSVSGTISLNGPKTLVGEGCLFAGLGCKAQTWTRIK